MSFSVHSFSVSAGRLGLAVLLACSSISAQSLTPSHPGFKAPVPTRQFMTPEQADILSHMSVVYLDDGQGGTVKTIRMKGANFQVVNGEGTTNTTNGLGNLIVGYNELGNPNGDDRTGSHNLVTGQANSFSSYGGLVAGKRNTTTAPWSSVSGGSLNSAYGQGSSVSGGTINTASGYHSSVSGGYSNTASGNYSSVSGGSHSSASGQGSSVIGGNYNTASGQYSSASGGHSNTASGEYTSVSGGKSRSAEGTFFWAAGKLLEAY